VTDQKHKVFLCGVVEISVEKEKNDEMKSHRINGVEMLEAGPSQQSELSASSAACYCRKSATK
jgi:hypothetical protein